MYIYANKRSLLQDKPIVDKEPSEELRKYA